MHYSVYNYQAYNVGSLTLLAGTRIFAPLDQRLHYGILLILSDAAFFLDGYFSLEMIHLHYLRGRTEKTIKGDMVQRKLCTLLSTI